MNIRERLGLGTVQFGLPYGISNSRGQTTSDEVNLILNFARKQGIQILDSASAYGNAEEVLGRNDLTGFKLVSKFMPPSAGAGIHDQLERSMKNLGLNSFYGYLAHRPLDLLTHPGDWEELNRLRTEGKVKKIGFSLNEPEELETLLDKGYQPSLIQVPYNYFDRRFEVFLKELNRDGCEIHTRSAFLQGLFFIKPIDLDDYFNEVKHLLGELQTYKTLNGALLKFVLEKPFIDKVITGIENQKQLEENLNNIEQAASLPDLQEKISDNILIPARWPK